MTQIPRALDRLVEPVTTAYTVEAAPPCCGDAQPWFGELHGFQGHRRFAKENRGRKPYRREPDVRCRIHAPSTGLNRVPEGTPRRASSHGLVRGALHPAGGRVLRAGGA